MPDKKPLNFTGRGFSKDPLSDEELAEMRERSKHYDDNFLSVDDFLAKAGLKRLSDIAKGVPSFVAVFLGMGSLAAAYFTLKSIGVLP